MAINGVSECYSFAVMTREEVDNYNWKLTVMAGSFLGFAWILSSFFGPIGFIMANGCNFAMRIGQNIYVINKKHSDNGQANNPLEGLIIPWTSVLALISAFIIAQVSELFVYDASIMMFAAAHLSIGALLFGICIFVINMGNKEYFRVLYHNLQ